MLSPVAIAGSQLMPQLFVGGHGSTGTGTQGQMEQQHGVTQVKHTRHVRHPRLGGGRGKGAVAAGLELRMGLERTSSTSESLHALVQRDTAA